MLKVLFALGKRKGCEGVWVAAEPTNIEANELYNSLNLSVQNALVFEGELL